MSEPKHSLQATAQPAVKTVWRNSRSQGNLSPAKSWHTACQNNIIWWTLEVTPVLVHHNDVDWLCGLQSPFSGWIFPMLLLPITAGQGRASCKLGNREAVPHHWFPVFEATACQEGGWWTTSRGADSGSSCQGPVLLATAELHGRGRFPRLSPKHPAQIQMRGILKWK